MHVKPSAYIARNFLPFIKLNVVTGWIYLIGVSGLTNTMCLSMFIYPLLGCYPFD